MTKALRRSAARLALLLLVVVPVAAWALVKPVRVIAPGLAGIGCGQGATVCVEDPAREAQARQLLAEGMAFVASHIAPVEGSPRFVFCSTQACADTFGLGERSAVTTGTWGTVIGPRAWAPHYVRHELIHHLQGQRLGLLPRLLKPTWWVEGMAYSLSEDPRTPLAEPWEGHRREFDAWYGRVGADRLWAEAGRL